MNPARAPRSAIVIGGGVIGLFTAWRLSDAGFKVTLIERDQVAAAAMGAASWAAGGILSPLPPWQATAAVWSLAAESIRSYPAIAAELAEATGIDPEWTASGMWVLDPDGEHAAEQAAAADWSGDHNMPVRNGRCPLALGRDASGLWLPWVAQLRSPRLCQALALRLRQLGVLIEEQSPVQALRIEGDRVALAGAAGCPDVVVVCAGAWSTPLLAPLHWPQSMAPVRGQMLLFRAEPGVLDTIVLDRDRYLIPRRDGRILVGSTLEPEAGFDARTTEAARQSLQAFALDLLPALAAYPIEAQWAGLRPGSPDGIPTIARHPQLSNLYLNAGHYRNGLTLAPASASRLLGLITA